MAINDKLISGSFWQDGYPFHTTPINTTSGSQGMVFWSDGYPFIKPFNISAPTAEEAAEGYGNAVMGVAAGSISTVMGVARANVSKVVGV